MDNLSAIVLAFALIIIMFGMGLSLTLDDFKRIFVYPKAMIIGLVNQIIILPLIGFTVASIFSLKPEIAIGLMILAACPGGPTSNLIAHLAKGDIALSVSLTAVSSFITILTIPFIVNFAFISFMDESQVIKLPVVATIMQIFAIIVVPVTIGMLLRQYKEKFALKMKNPARKASGIVFVIIILGVVIKERANVIPYFQQAGLVALLLNIVTMTIGYYSAKLFKVLDKRAISISIESGIQNGTLAITIALILIGNSEYAITPAIYSLLMFFTGGVAIYLGNKKARKLKSGS